MLIRRIYHLEISPDLLEAGSLELVKENEGLEFNGENIVENQQDDANFFTSAKIVKERFWFWLTFMGSSDEAENYSSSISIENKVGKKFDKFNFTGSVHTLDEKAHDIIGSGSLLSIGINEAKRLLTEEKELQVEITIRNLKEEAKDEDIESGVSDGE